MKPALALSLSILLAAIACGTEQAATGPAGGSAGEQGRAEAGAPSGAGKNFVASACRACQAVACASPEADCNSEPGCAEFLGCVDACATTQQGGVDAACVGQCALPQQDSLVFLAHALLTCREQGHGLACPCGEKPETIELLKQECGPSAETNPCFKCEDEKCCETLGTCFDDDECHAFTDCLKTCTLAGFAKCEMQCGALHPTGFQKGLERITCVLQQCAEGDQCGEGDLDPCVKCVNDRCAEEYVACGTNIRCTRVSACAEDCGVNPDCFQSCFELDAEGGKLYQGYTGCGIARCASECG